MTNIKVIENSKELTFKNNTESLIDKYFKSLDVNENTKRSYRRALKQFVLYANTEGIAEPTRSDIIAYKNYLMKNYTPCTVSSYMTPLRGLYAYLENEGIGKNIAKGIKGGKHQSGFKKDPLTVDQAKDLLIEIDNTDLKGKRDLAIINLLIRTGLRTIELERANIEDIRQESGEALLYIQGKGRHSKDEFVLLTQATLKPIYDYLTARGKAEDDEPLFISLSNKNYGGRLTTRSISRVVKANLKASGIESDRITAHSLRHTAVTLSLLAGATIQEAQGLARHKNINTTMIYAHNINRVKNAPERKIDQILA